jgi:hypothetical protein
MVGQTAVMDLDAVTDELYGLSPDAFIAARDARAAEARQNQERGLADAIKSLRKPTVSAALVNRLVRERGREVEDLLALGEALRRAQADLAGDELRELSRRRATAVEALGRAARELAAEAGPPASEATVAEAEATLEAAVLDPAAAEAVRAGRLSTALHYSGLGLDDIGAPPAAGRTRGRTSGTARPTPATGDGRRGRAAPPGVADAESAVAAATGVAAAARAEAERAERDLERLRAQLAQAEDRAKALRGEHRAAIERGRRAQRALEQAEQEERRAQAALRRARHPD